jgi:cobalt-zinc-cadmium efflux system membrane fusion protein
MKKIFPLIPLILLFLNACQSETPERSAEKTGNHKEEDHADSAQDFLKLSRTAFNNMKFKVGPLPYQALQNSISAKGMLTVPPQNQAAVSSMIGANVQSIEVLEGDKVKKGSILAYLAHPNLMELQSNYVSAFTKADFLKSELERQEKLYAGKVGSGKELKQTQSQYNSARALKTSLEEQLKMLHLNVAQVQEGNLYQRVPLKAPIEGYVQKVLVKTGQYVSPQTQLFEILDIHHLHVDLMIYEKDVPFVKVNQKVRVRLRAHPDSLYTARIFAIGKNIEEASRAVHLHAELEKTNNGLVSGMYASGSIITDTTQMPALPADAVVQDNEGFYVFKVVAKNQSEVTLQKLKVTLGAESAGFRPVLSNLEYLKNGQLILNQAYYLFSEMEGGEGHHH